MVAYWNKRLEVFGPERAFLPLTLSSGILIKEDLAALQVGLLRTLPDKVDPDGRMTCFADPSRANLSLYSTINMVRASWYVLDAALEDEDTQRKGLILISFPKNAKNVPI